MWLEDMLQNDMHISSPITLSVDASDQDPIILIYRFGNNIVSVVQDGLSSHELCVLKSCFQV